MEKYSWTLFSPKENSYLQAFSCDYVFQSFIQVHGFQSMLAALISTVKTEEKPKLHDWSHPILQNQFFTFFVVHSFS